MAKRKTRRTYRQFFRGMRVYLPLVFLLFTAMVFFLPLSAPWMARRTEKEIRKLTGLPVTIETLEVTLAEGKIQAVGVAVEAPAGERSFRIGRVALEGSITSLLGGNESWPSEVTIDGVPQVLLEKNKEGLYELHGSFRSLIDQLQNLKKKNDGGEKTAAEKGAAEKGKIGRTPRVIIRSIPISIDPPRHGLPSISMTLDQIELAERPAPGAPFRLTLDGIALADSLERFSLHGIYIPDEARLGLEGTLSGVSVPFGIPPLGEFTSHAKNLAIELNGRKLEDGRIEASLNAKAGYFEVMQDRLGGQRWEDEPLEVRVRGEYDPANQHLKVGQLSLTSVAAKIDVKGQVTLAGDLPGDAEVHVERLPRGALALLQNELTERLNVSIDATATSPTLTIAATANGHFAKPEEMNSSAVIHVQGWSVSAPMLPAPVVVNDLDVTASRDSVELRSLVVEFGGLNITASGNVPVCAGQSDRVGGLNVTAEGNVENAFDFLSRKGMMPTEINYVRLPVSLEATVTGRLDCDNPIMPKVITPRIDSVDGSVTWKQGEVGLRDFADSIHLEPGRATLLGREATLERFFASSRNITVKADGTVENLPLPYRPTTGKPLITGNVTSSGAIPDLIALIGRHVTLPPLPRNLVGQYQLTLAAKADTAAMPEADYNLRLLVDKGGADVETPFRVLHVADASTDLTLDRNVLEIRRMNLKLADAEFGDSTVNLKASVDRTAIRADVDVHSKLELLPAILPEDLKDLYMKGPLAAAGWARFTPKEPLPADEALVEAWVGFLKKPGFTVGVKGEPDLMADFELSNRQEAPVEFFPRDFPVRISNIRGNAAFTPKGIELKEFRADFGSAKDVMTSGTIQLGIPVRVKFSADIDKLDVNEWTDGWKQREWAAYSASFEPKWKAVPTPYQQLVIDAHIKSQALHFLQFDAEQVDGDLHFESWSRIPNTLTVTGITAKIYGGDAKGDLSFKLQEGEKPILTAKTEFVASELKPFMDALYQREQKMDGLITTDLNFSGQLLNYPTYKGDARYSIEGSSVIGNVILEYARNVLEVTSTTGMRDSIIHGTANMYDQKVFLPDIVIINPGINLAAEGYVDFRGKLFFDVTASVLTKRLKEIPVVRIFVDVVDMVGNEIVSYEVRGTLKEPKYRPVFTPIGRLSAIREVLKESQKPVILPRQTSPTPSPSPTPTAPRK